MEKGQKADSISRCHVKTHECGDQDQQSDSRLRQLQQIRKTNTVRRHLQRTYFHTGTLIGTITKALNVSSSDVPSTRAPVATCVVVGMTAFAVQTVKAPRVICASTKTSIVSAGL